MKRTLISIFAALAVASGASAATLSIDADAASYGVGDTITITAIFDATGATASPGDGSETVAISVTWEDAVADALGAGAFGSSSQSADTLNGVTLTSFGGAIPWLGNASNGCVSAGPSAGSECILISQGLLAGDFAPDANTVTATLQLTAVAVGALNLGDIIVNTLGNTTVSIGSNFTSATVVPEPGTALMLGLGLLGLGFTGRRR